MRTALAGRASIPFDVPEGIAYVEIDPLTGKLAGPECPKRFNEAFLAGTEPTEMCELHR
jgi:membrane carboxypeptidase/penicillin-binding protein